MGWGLERERGVQATDRASLLLALLLKKICNALCVFGRWWCFSFIYLFISHSDMGPVKINNASVIPEVLNSGVWKEERKNTTSLPK